MKSRPSLIKFLIPVMIFVISTACQLDIPTKDIIAARAAIEEAKKYDAEKHAPEDIKKAEDLLLKSHNFIQTGNIEESKQAAVDALAAAQEAEKKALPLYASEKIKNADDAYNEADLAYSEKFSPEKFAEAGTLNVEAKSLYEKNDYKNSAGNAIKSYELSVAAKNESLQNSSVIEKEVNSAENKLSELKGDKFSSAAEGNLANAGASIDNAKKGIDKKDYKTSLKEIEIAKKELESAAELIRKQKVSAAILRLRGDMKDLQGKSESADVKEDLDNAMLELNGAEASLEQNNITDAELKVENAEKLLSTSNIKMKKQNARAAIEKAEKLLVQAREKDTDSTFKENLDKAETLIGEGKASIEAEKFNDGIASAEEAEALINTVLNSIEAAAAELAVKAQQEKHEEEETVTTEEVKVEEKPKEEPGTTYVVKWRKKNTDCLWRIAETVYKDASYWPAIYLANKDQIKDPDLIFPGQKFSIPPKPQKRPSYKKIREQIEAETK